MARPFLCKKLCAIIEVIEGTCECLDGLHMCTYQSPDYGQLYPGGEREIVYFKACDIFCAGLLYPPGFYFDLTGYLNGEPNYGSFTIDSHNLFSLDKQLVVTNISLTPSVFIELETSLISFPKTVLPGGFFPEYGGCWSCGNELFKLRITIFEQDCFNYENTKEYHGCQFELNATGWQYNPSAICETLDTYFVDLLNNNAFTLYKYIYFAGTNKPLDFAFTSLPLDIPDITGEPICFSDALAFVSRYRFIQYRWWDYILINLPNAYFYKRDTAGTILDVGQPTIYTFDGNVNDYDPPPPPTVTLTRTI